MGEPVYRVLLLAYIGITETLMVHFAFNSLLKRNKRSSRCYIIALVIYSSCTIFDAALNLPIYFVLSFCYFLILGIAFLFYDNPSEIRIIVPFIFVTLNYASTIFSTTLVWYLSGNTMAQFPLNLRQNFTSQTLLLFIFSSLVFCLSSLHKQLIKKSGKSLTLTALNFLSPLSMLFFLINLFYLAGEPQSEGVFISTCLCIAVLLLLTSLTLFSLFDRINNANESKNYSKMLVGMLSMQERYYSSLQTHQKELRKIQHDIKSHTRIVLSLIEKGQYSSASEYLSSISMSVQQNTMVTECKNQLLGALLNDKLSCSKELGIGVSLCVMVPEVMEIQNIDICILLGNLLDNAVYACSRMDEKENRFIDVDIRLNGPLLCICVKNSYSGLLNFENNRYLSTKENPASHGIGLSNVRQVTDKHKGRLTITHSETVFSVTAILRYSYCEDDDY